MKQLDRFLPNWLVKVLTWVQKHGGYWFGHLPVVFVFLHNLEDALNNKGLRQTKAWRKGLARMIHWTFGQTIYYLDYVNGDAGNDGSDWANAKKRFNDFSGLVAGSVVRIAKSDDPISLGNVIFTNESNVLTLATAKTLEIDDCEDAWTASANVTCTTSTDRYTEGAKSSKIVIASGFTTGKAAYFATGELDLSSFTGFSFAIHSDSAESANRFRLDLCSDTTGDTPVHSYTMDFAHPYSKWCLCYHNTEGALNSSIKSVALTVLSDPGTATLYIDNIFACDDDLHLGSLIGKNNMADGWYRVVSVDDTTVKIGVAYDNYIPITTEKYHGTSETVTGYSINPIFTGSDGASQEITDSGSAGSLIEWLGGFNTSTSLQDGKTWYRGIGCNYSGLVANNPVDYIKLQKIGVIDCNYGMYLRGTGCEYDNLFGVHCKSKCIYVCGSTNCTGSNLMGSCTTDADGLYLDARNSTFSNLYVFACYRDTGSSGIILNMVYSVVDTVVVKGCYRGIRLNNGDNSTIVDVALSYNEVGIYDASSGNEYNLINTTFSNNTTDATESSTYAGGAICLTKVGGSSTDHRMYLDFGTIFSEDTVRHTASGLAWKMTPTNALVPIRLHPRYFRIAVNASSEVTITAYVRKDSSFNGTARLVLVGGILTGIGSDVTDTHSAAADEWEQLSVAGTPTEAGVLEFYVDAKGTAGNIYVDDAFVSQ